MITNTQSFIIPNATNECKHCKGDPMHCTHQATVLVFTEESFHGMVGETCQSYGATLLHPLWIDSKKISYALLRAWYCRVKGKKERIAYHRWMKEFDPKVERERLAEETADAIGRVI